MALVLRSLLFPGRSAVLKVKESADQGAGHTSNVPTIATIYADTVIPTETRKTTGATDSPRPKSVI